ncbi:hypothetical protein ACOME3_002311 [Neoechinorhynchus agilis]
MEATSGSVLVSMFGRGLQNALTSRWSHQCGGRKYPHLLFYAPPTIYIHSDRRVFVVITTKYYTIVFVLLTATLKFFSYCKHRFRFADNLNIFVYFSPITCIIE